MKTLADNSLSNESDLQDNWRESYLQRLIVLTAAVGLIALIPTMLRTSDFTRQGVYISVFVLIVVVIVLRLPYMVKAGTFVLLPLVLGFSSLSETGIRGYSLFFLLAFVIFASLLMGSRAGFTSIVISEIFILGMGYFVLNGHYTLSDRLAYRGDVSDWIIAAAFYFFISIASLFALGLINQSVYKTRRVAIETEQLRLTSLAELDNLVEQRTFELARKTNLLSVTSSITHQIAIVPDLDDLLNRVVDLVSEHLACNHVGIYLINQRGDYVSLQAASSETGKRLIEQGFRTRIGTEGIIGYVAADKKPRISMDIGREFIILNNPDLAETQIEMALPLVVHKKTVGVLDLHSPDTDAFRYDDIDIFQSMADQIAVAIDRARIITDSRLSISQLEMLSNENTRQNWNYESEIRNSIFRYSASGVDPVETTLPQAKNAGNVLYIPIMLRGQKIGNISLIRKAGYQKWSAQEETIASEVAIQSGLALENIRLVERTRERANREQIISRVSARIRESLDLDIVLRTSAQEIRKALGLQEAEVRLMSQNNADDEERRIDATF